MKEINNDTELSLALVRLEKVFNAKEGTKESDEANRLAAMIEEYETKNPPLG